MSDTETCPVAKRGGAWSHAKVCGKPLRTDEQRNARKCGLHLAAQRKREESAAARDVAYKEADASLTQARHVAAALANHGVAVTVGRPEWGEPAQVVMTVEQAESLLAKLDGPA